MKRDIEAAALARDLLLPASSADVGRLPVGFVGGSTRALRKASVALAEGFGCMPADIAAIDIDWFNRLRSALRLDAMIYLAGGAVYGRALRSKVGSPLVRALAERVGGAAVQELMRVGEGPHELPAPVTLEDLRDAGGALLLDYLHEYAAAAARHVLARIPADEAARWRDACPVDAELRDALVQRVLRVVDTTDR